MVADQTFSVRRDCYLPAGGRWGYEVGSGVVQFPNDPTDSPQSGQVEWPLIMGECSGHVFQHLPALLIQTMDSRHTVQPVISEMPQQCVHGWRGRGRRLAHGVANADHGIGDVAAGERYFRKGHAVDRRLGPVPLPPLARIAALLSAAWAGRIDILSIDRIEPWSVARAKVRGGDADTVIVKWVRSGDPDDPDARAHPRQLATEAMALEFLSTLDVTHAPRLIGLDPDRSFLIMEDAAGRRPLDQVIKRDGYDHRVHTHLIDFAATLARQHSATAGHADRFHAQISQLIVPDPERERRRFLRRGLDRTIEAVGPLGCPEPSPEVWAEATEVDRLLDQPGPLLAMSNGDAATNNFLVDGSGGTLIDFEFAGYRHCITDLTDFYLPSPRWITVDDPVRLGVEDTYREIAGRAIPELLDDDRFDTDVVAACLTWARIRMNNFSRIDARPAGDPSRLQRLVTVETAAGLAESRQRFLALTDWLRSVAGWLRRRWPDVDVDVDRLGPYRARDRNAGYGAMVQFGTSSTRSPSIDEKSVSIAAVSRSFGTRSRW